MTTRYLWDVFPPVLIHANESTVKQHPSYRAAKSGDPDAAYLLVNALLNLCGIYSPKLCLGHRQ